MGLDDEGVLGRSISGSGDSSTGAVSQALPGLLTGARGGCGGCWEWWAWDPEAQGRQIRALQAAWGRLAPLRERETLWRILSRGWLDLGVCFHRITLTSKEKTVGKQSGSFWDNPGERNGSAWPEVAGEWGELGVFWRQSQHDRIGSGAKGKRRIKDGPQVFSLITSNMVAVTWGGEVWVKCLGKIRSSVETHISTKTCFIYIPIFFFFLTEACGILTPRHVQQ